MLKIEEGKYYRTQDGRKVLVESNPNEDAEGWPWATRTEGFHAFDRNGKSCIGSSYWDLVAIWQDGPVVTETVTKTRIVPGVYDGVIVSSNEGRTDNKVHIDLAGRYTADELDAAAAVLSALAKGVRDA